MGCISPPLPLAPPAAVPPSPRSHPLPPPPPEAELPPAPAPPAAAPPAPAPLPEAAPQMPVPPEKGVADKLIFRKRIIGRYGTGSTPLESGLFLAGANPESMMDNKYVRSSGFIPTNFKGYGGDFNHFQHGGGLNLRGYAGRVLSTTDKDGNLVPVFRSHSGAAINLEVDFNRYLPFRFRKLSRSMSLSTYIFADVGVIDLNQQKDYIEPSDIKADAGIGFVLSWYNFGPLYDIEPIRIRFDMPFYVNDPETGTSTFAPRWLIGINRSF